MGVREIGQWLFFLTPYLLLIGAYVGVLCWTFGSPRPSSIRAGVVVSLLAACAAIARAYWHFFTTWSSMGGLGLFFLPVYAALIGVVGYLGGWSGTVLLQACTGIGLSGSRPRMLSTAIAAVTRVILAISGYRIVSRQLLLARAQERTGMYLPSIVKQAMAARDVEVLERVAAHSDVPILEELYAFGERDSIFREFNSPYFSVWHALAGNPYMPSELLALLARHPGGDVEKRVIGSAIATNPSAPTDVLADLADDPDETVRELVCLNPRLSAEVLLKLKNDTSARVRGRADYFLRKRHAQ